MELTDTEKLIRSYPRTRSELPECYQEIYEQEYAWNREGKDIGASLAHSLEEWMHREVAKISNGRRTLELGAGTLNHLDYEKIDGRYDIVEPSEFLFQGSKNLQFVQSIFRDVEEISLDARYGRIISIAVLEHLTHLPFIVAKCGLLLTRNGTFQAGIPCEGELAWYLGWRCSTGISYYLRNKLDYGVLMRFEHINKCEEIIEIIKYFFEEVKIKRFPIPIKHLSFYIYIEARNPRREICGQYVCSTSNPTS